MRQLNELLCYQDDLIELSALKTRPPIMRDLIPPSIPLSTIYAVYKAVNKSGPPRGQLPQEIRVFFSSPKKRLHASAILSIWDRFKGLQEDKVKRHIKSYHMYVSSCGEMEPLYDFNRAWFLIRQYEMRRVGMRTCPSCRQRYAYNREDVADVNNCHGCPILVTEEQAADSRLPKKRYG